MQDDEILSTCCVEDGPARLWYVFIPLYMNDVEQFVLQKFFNHDYLNDYEHGGTQIFTQEAILSNRCLAQSFGAALPLH